MAAKTASLSVNIIADAAKAKAGLKEAQGAFGKFGQSINDANGAMGKFKVGAGAALDYVKSNAVNFAAAAGAAVVAFGVKSVKAFQDLALGVGKFSDATGMSLDAASRFIEVAGDIGIEAGTLEKSLNFMNKTMGNSPQLFKDLGIQIEYTSSGAKDMSGTFLNVIDRINGIKDPAEKAAVASKLLGRGWTEMAELIAQGSGSLSKSLAEVSSQRIVTEQQRKQAEDFRTALDELNDRIGNISLSVGSKLVPSITNAIDGFLDLVDVIKEIPIYSDILENIFNPGVTDEGRSATVAGGIAWIAEELFGLNKETKTAVIVTDDMARVWRDGYSAMVSAQPAAQNLNKEIERQKEVLDRARGAWDLFKNGLNIRAERLALDGDIEAFRKKWESSTDDAKANSREYQEELLRLQVRVAGLATEVATTASAASRNLIKVLVDTGQLERALQYIEMLKAGYDEARRLSYQNYAPPPPSASAPAPRAPAPPPAKTPASMLPPKLTPREAERLAQFRGLARGGTLTSSGLVVVGEDGPELLGLPRGASVTPNIPQRLNDMAGGGMTVVVNVQAGLVSSPDQVGAQIIDAIRRAERRSGQVFASA